MLNSLKESLYRINLGLDIDPKLIQAAFQDICETNFPGQDAQLGSFFMGLMAKGPDLTEVISLIDVVLSMNQVVRVSKSNKLKDKKIVCFSGSGKKGIKTFNISTPSLLTAAACGAFCFKPVSGSTSSMTGSADFLSAVGVNTKLDIAELMKVIEECGFAAYDIALSIPKFDELYGGKFYAPHVLSYGLPAIATPIIADYMVYGIAHPNIQLAAKVLRHYGYKNCLIVSSSPNKLHYIDELIPMGQNAICGVKDGQLGSSITFRPDKELGLQAYDIRMIQEGDDKKDNIKTAVQVMLGKGNPAQQDTICLNAGNLLYMAGLAKDYINGYYLAKAAIKSGKVIEKLMQVIDATGGNLNQLEPFLGG